MRPFAQVKASYKLSEDFKKGPAKPKKVAKAKVSLLSAEPRSDVTLKLQQRVIAQRRHAEAPGLPSRATVAFKKFIKIMCMPAAACIVAHARA